jgi:hypothetical protein
MPLLSSYKPDTGIRALLCGPSSSGKTCAVASFATKDEPLYIFDMDNRIAGILGCPHLKENIPYIEYDSYTSRQGFGAIEKKCEEFYNRYAKRDLRFKNFLFDSIGSLTRIFHRDSIAQRGAPISNMNLSGTLNEYQKRGLRILGNVALEGPEDYKYSSTCFNILIQNYFAEFKDINIFLTGWTLDRYGKDPNNPNPYSESILLPGKKLHATGKLAAEIPGYFNETWEFEKLPAVELGKGPQYLVQFNTNITKTCYPALSAVGQLDITSKSFRDVLLKEIASNGPAA